MSRASTTMLLLLVLPASGPSSAPSATTSGALDQKVDPAVIAAIDSGHATQVIVLGSRQLIEPGQVAAYRRKHLTDDRLALRREVVPALKRIARAQQPAILQALHIARAERSLWIVNAVLLTLTPDQVRRAATLGDVAFIYPAADTVRPPDTTGGPALVLPAEPRPPFSTAGKRIPWNVAKLDAPRVWDELHDTGDGIVVASLDLGSNYAHHDLRHNLWINRRELAGNGRDDDGNGYVDDVYGYDFRRMSPEVRDTTQPRQHGTMTAGIIVGDGSDGIVTGVAPRARVMILRGFSATEAGLAMQYAIENGADIFSMSFSLGQLGNTRGLWRMMSDHAIAAGLVLVGGAGNFRKTATLPEQVQTPKDIPDVIAVGGIDSLGATATFSSGGPVAWSDVALYHDYPMPAGLVKPDVVAFPGPGYPVLSSIDSGYVDPNPRIAGNSFSGPQGAGVAALMLAVAPRLTAWRIKDLIEATARPIGPGGKDNDTGYGRIDAFAAVLAARATLHRRVP